MFKSKLLASILLAVMVIAAQFGAAYAASPTQTATPATPAAPITGTVQTITLKTDSTTGTTTVIVTVLDSTNTTQTVNLSVATAVSLGLVTLDTTTGLPVVNQTQVGKSISIDLSQTIPTTTPTPTAEPQNPVAGALALFFGVDNATINGFHSDGFGYGVIAQALWMSKILNGNGTTTDGIAITANDILTAKKTGDYSAFIFADGATPTNWGQFRKELLSGHARDNLGAVMSGANSGGMTPSADGNGPQGGNPGGNAGGNGNGHGHGHGRP